MGKKRSGEVEGSERAQILLDSEWAVLRDVDFPLGDPIDQGAVQVAKMLGVPFEELEASRAADDIPDFWPLPSEALAVNHKDKNMANENAEKVLASGWDEVDKSVGASGSWMKWTENQVHQLNVCGTPRHVEKVYEGEAKKRIAIDVYVPGEGGKTWEMAPATWRDLKEERDSCKTPFGEAVFAVKRVGSGKDTRYKFRYQRQLTAAELSERGTVGSVSAGGGDDIPF